MTHGSRRFVMGLGVAAALVGGGAVAAHLRETRQAELERHAEARALQRKAAGGTQHAEAAGAETAARAGKVGCVKGVDSFAVAISRVDPPPAVSGKEPRSRRAEALARLSDRALRAEKVAEATRPAPTLPRRMGLLGDAPVAPERSACDGAGYAEFELKTP